MKRFLKESGHADSYENLEVNFIPGRNPDLIMFVSVFLLHIIRQNLNNTFNFILTCIVT